jgi:Tol biopolymer transport system component/tRNA A-37 threonylcarbamoyl transferase component Bud32
LTEAADRLTSAVSDRYRIERELGSGGMATVYLAEDLRHHRKVAVKVLRPELAATLGSERFFREIEVAARLQHPHILPLLDSGEADGFLYYVMPYVAGESLRERLAREGELPVHDAVKILAEVVDALAAAHAEGIVHRDIKPDNVLLSGRHALVTDFGVAKAVSEATGRQKLTTAGVALGTPSYMAPEQATADPHLDHRVDIYAAGVLGYEMLTGGPPFSGRTAQEILAAQVTQAPQVISARRTAVPAPLEAVIMRCPEKRPADRWQKADDLLAQLEILATPTAGVTPTQTRPMPMAAPPRQFPRWVAWLAGGALVAAGALALSLRQRGPDVLMLGKRTLVAGDPTVEVWPTLTPDGKTIVFTKVVGTDAEIVVQQVEGGAPLVVTAQVPGPNWYQALSPDGSRMIFAGSDGLYLMPTLGGQARRIVPGPAEFPSWSQDGSRVVYAGIDTLFVQPVDQPARTVLAVGPQLHSPAWSPDGEWVVYVEGNRGFYYNGNTAPSVIRLVRAWGGPPLALTDSTSFNTAPTWIPGRRAVLYISDRDGGRDIFQLDLRSSGEPRARPTRLTTGLNPDRMSFSADGRRLAWSTLTQTSNYWSLPIQARDSVPLSRATRITSGTQNIEIGSISSDGTWLYYDSDRSGNSDLWRVPVAGGQPEQLTRDPADDFAPAVSPDGREVAFHSVRNGASNRDVFVMPVVGGPAVQVSTSPGDDRAPEWSADGQALLWRDNLHPDSNTLVAWRDARGAWGQPTRFPSFPLGGWFPDGGILMADTLQVWRLDPRSGDRQVLYQISGGGSYDGAYMLSQDGKTLYRAGYRPGRAGATVESWSIPSGPWRSIGWRTLAWADEPYTQVVRYGAFVHGGRIYLPLVEPRLDIWVAEVGP